MSGQMGVKPFFVAQTLRGASQIFIEGGVVHDVQNEGSVLVCIKFCA